MLKIAEYRPERKPDWDRFVDCSKNGIFQFRRDYMEYHSDRFRDFSLIAEDSDGRIAALLPASVADDAVTSHAGLTFGGFVTDSRMKVAATLGLFEQLRAFLRARGIARLVYKAVPHIYHRIPAEEDRYALFRCGARLVRCDVSSAIRQGARLPISKGRRWAIKQAQKAGLTVEQSTDFAGFMRLEEALLAEKYAARPTHSAAELELLASRFPDQIKLFVVRGSGELLAGVVIYDYGEVAHAQYIAASDDGKRLGALDLILDRLIGEEYGTAPVFDFGISTERQGTYLNEGLIANKQSFGARAIVHETFEWDLGG